MNRVESVGLFDTIFFSASAYNAQYVHTNNKSLVFFISSPFFVHVSVRLCFSITSACNFFSTFMLRLDSSSTFLFIALLIYRESFATTIFTRIKFMTKFYEIIIFI